MNRKLIIVQDKVASYRTALFTTIKNALPDQFAVYAGERFFDPSIQLDSTFKPEVVLENKFFLSNRFLWQYGLLKYSLNPGVFILSLNPRVLSSWIVLLIRRLFNKPVILWGHAWPKDGKDSRSDLLRHLMRLLSDKIIVYTDRQKTELQLKLPGKRIYVAPNALYTKNQMLPLIDGQPNNIIYVGRMDVHKKVILLYKAFKQSLPNLPQDSKLLLIGDGPERNHILQSIERDQLQHRVLIPGAISDIDTLFKYYKTSLISVSPGRVGLGLIQSLGFGVPMIIARNELHGPEIEAAREDKTWFFNEDDKYDLSLKIQECYSNKSYILSQREEICRWCKNRYSIEAMASTFIKLVKDS